MKKTKNLYITTMGTMGSGKTTAAKLLAQALDLHLLEEQFGENAFLSRFYADMKRWAFHSQTFYLMEKIAQMMHTKTLLEDHGVIQDTPIQQDVFSYARAQHLLGNMDDAEWKLYQKIYHSFEEHLPKPHLIVYLKTSLPTLMNRIEQRGRSYEQKVPQTYVEILDEFNNAWLHEHKEVPILEICTDDLNIVTSKKAREVMIEKVKEALKVRGKTTKIFQR